MNPFDALVAWFHPVAALRRQAARRAMASYEAASPGRLRKFYRERHSPNKLVEQSAPALRAQARHLCRNHDLARGALRVLVNNVVGPAGIGIEPQPRRRDGTIHDEYAGALRNAWRDWTLCPEVTRRLTWAKTQRTMARTWIRDGEALAQQLAGPVPMLDHGTRVPYSLELLEPDLLPLEYSDGGRITQGVERNAWGRAVAYHLLRAHPFDTGIMIRAENLKRVPADMMLHLAELERIGQVRGVSEFASVITRLEDIKDYEESERVAAKIAAMMTGYVKRGNADLFDPTRQEKDEQGNVKPREIALEPGMIFDGLGVGEDVGIIDSQRPNPNLVTFRQGQLRAVAAGLGASYSSVSRDYNGTWSAQRQELVEQWVHYAVLTDDFTGMFVRPVWERFVAVADLSGVVPMPADLQEGSADDALFVGQSMPWIDPIKEATAWRMLTQDGFASEVEVMRRRGVNPRDVLEQIDAWRKDVKSRGLVLTSDAAHTVPAAAPKAEPPDAEDTADTQDTPDTSAAHDVVKEVERDAEGRILRIVERHQPAAQTAARVLHIVETPRASGAPSS